VLPTLSLLLKLTLPPARPSAKICNALSEEPNDPVTPGVWNGLDEGDP